MKNTILILLAVFFVNLVYSQEYGSALGIKSGYPGYIGLNYKKNLDRKLHRFALDNMLGVNFDSDNRYVTGQILFEVNKKLGFNTGWNIYGGIGATGQYYTSGGFLTDSMVTYNGFFGRGDLVFGVEKFNEGGFPINIAVEGGPVYYFTPIQKFTFQFTVALRYGFPENRKKRF